MAGGISLELADHLYPHYVGRNPEPRQISEEQALVNWQAEQERLAQARSRFAELATKASE